MPTSMTGACSAVQSTPYTQRKTTVNDNSISIDVEAISAAVEVYRRSLKGRPIDRWGSDEQLRLAARGIGELLRMNDIFADAWSARLEDDRRRGLEAMDATPDPLRKDNIHGDSEGMVG